MDRTRACAATHGSCGALKVTAILFSHRPYAETAATFDWRQGPVKYYTATGLVGCAFAYESARRTRNVIGMSEWPEDIYTEPQEDPDTLANLGPLAPMAGIWRGDDGVDVKPKADGPRSQAYVEYLELHPIDAQTNGPQLLYGLRYHARMTKPQLKKTYHDQVGYWLWEPATERIYHSLTIPRGQAALAGGHAAPDARQFTLRATRGDTAFGIVSNPFLEQAFRTEAFEITVTIGDDDTWSYDETTTLLIKGQAEPFLHTDSNRLIRVGPPQPNPRSA